MSEERVIIDRCVAETEARVARLEVMRRLAARPPHASLLNEVDEFLALVVADLAEMNGLR